jgi:hypothetical protein
MQNVMVSLAGVVLALSSSCALPDGSYGAVSTCIAVETLPTDSGPLFEEGDDVVFSRTGLRTATADEHLEPPEQFAICAADNTVNLELVEADGRHVWLSIDATFNDEPLLPADLLSNLQNATLEIEHRQPWFITDHVTISDDNGLVATLHSGPVAAGGGINVVAESSGPTVPATCGWATAQHLRFNDSLVLNSGDTGSLELDNGSATVVNMYSTRTEQHCDDGYTGVFAIWAAYRN